jgi:hypothetical protein
MRPLSSQLAAALAQGQPQPARKLLAYDPAIDSISAIVLGQATQTPFDLTPYCSDINWAPAQLSFTLADPGSLFNPDAGSARAFLVDRAIIRLLEGDARVPEADWMWTFTGCIHGQIGWQESRASKKMEGKVTVMARENTSSFKKRSITTRKYTVGSDIGVMLADLCTQFLGVSAGERRLPEVLGLQLLHNVNQLSQVPPWDGLSAILETISHIPYFDGEGKLTAINQNLSRAVDRVLPDYIQVLDWQIPARSQDFYNRIDVTFTDAEMSRVDGADQKLGSANITTGFFEESVKLKCYWSDDRRQRAYKTRLKKVKSLNTTVARLIWGHNPFTESYQALDEFHGEISIKTSILVPIAGMAFFADYLAACFIPDSVVAVIGGVTIPVGRVIEGADMVGMLMVMMTFGSGQYEIWGTPYDFAYLERKAVAIQDGLEYWEENPRAIKNDFLGSMDQARAVAMTQLTWEESNACPRQLILNNDLTLEKGDIIQLPDGRKFLITDLGKTIKRGEMPVLTLQGFKVRTA